MKQGWKFQPADNPAYAQHDFDDSQWGAIDPTLDIHYLPQLGSSPIGWLRVRFTVDSSLLNRPLAMQVYQHLASEIYLNGRLIKKYGKVSADPELVRAFRPLHEPIGVLFEQREQVLAVRVSFQKDLPYFDFNRQYTALAIRINKVEAASSFQAYQRRFDVFLLVEAGVFLLLSIIHLGFFYVYQERKANLYFSIATLSCSFGNLLYVFITQASDVVFVAYAAMIDWFLLYCIYNLFLFIAIFSLFSARKGILFWLLVTYYILGAPLFLLDFQWGFTIGILIPFVLSMLVSLRVTLQAYRRQNRGASIIILGLISYLVLFSIFIGMYQGRVPIYDLGSVYTTQDLLYHLGFLSIPLSVSWYLSREFAYTSKDLEANLIEVKQLSAKTLAQEQEKQQLLASQNEMLELQVAERTSELKESLDNLKSTQAQLVQKEKMASLGELTAAIAHEIQNPLNFVNNFSELSQELCQEVYEEVKQLNVSPGEKKNLQELVSDLSQNQKRVLLHGQRADAIVRGMLEHSRASTGEKQQTDINALVDEYMRLSYSGFRAKNKDFSCILNTCYDPNLKMVEVVPQDLGRVLLNLFNNAFYAVQQKQKLGLVGYEAKVAATTSIQDGKVEIRVWDNGTGVPESIKGKIFQPFFTTKPTGQGTGLGLSLSYDIITKRHGGELSLVTEQGEWAEFTITLPYVSKAKEPTLHPAPN